jgi:hypothetical protein
MRVGGRKQVAVVATLLMLLGGRAMAAETYEQQSALRRALYTGIAVAANILPGVSALYVPRCLPGYIVCKLSFAGVSLLAAADQLGISGGGDMEQTRAILYRGFAGDWYLTGRHVAGFAKPQVLPDPPPPTDTGTEGEWEPPPL